MDVGFGEAPSRCVVEGSRAFEDAEIIVDSSNSSSDSHSNDASSYKDYVYVASSGEENSYNAVKVSDDLNGAVDNASQEDNPKFYLSSGVYFQPLGENCENMVGVIKIDPNKHPLQEGESTAVYELYPTSQNWCEEGSNHYQYSFSFDNFNARNPSYNNNGLECLKLLYDASDAADVCAPDSPEYIDINSIIPHQALKCSVPPFLKRRGRSKPEMAATVLNLSSHDDDCDDDVIFVSEYKDEKNPATAEASKTEVIPASSSSTPTVRRRRRRKIYGEKRRNPLRKAQIDKASADLIEKLSIPPSVFNARVKKRNPKTQASIVDHKNLRQSCRTTGAILRPPSPLNENDFREWPVEGMHERPFYYEQTGTMYRWDFETLPEDVQPEYAFQPIIFASTVGAKGNSKERLSSRRRSPRTTRFSKDNNSEAFIRLSHDRFHMMLNYGKELKEFNILTLANAQSDQEQVSAKETLASNTENSQEQTCAKKTLNVAHVSAKPTTENQQIDTKAINTIEYNESTNISSNVVAMIENACILYGLANGTSDVDMANYINSLGASKEKF